MKNFIKSRCFPLAVATVVLLVIIVAGFLFGFRITYTPDLNNCWDAISGVAAWIGIVVSIVSVVASFMAIRYAVSVADKQNKIALFEKRYECYVIIKKVLDAAKYLNKSNSYYHTYIQLYYVVELPNEKMMDSLELAFYYQKLRDKVMLGIFLFSDFNEVEIRKMFGMAFDLAYKTSLMDVDGESWTMSADFIKLRDEYYNYCKEFRERHLKNIEHKLQFK